MPSFHIQSCILHYLFKDIFPCTAFGLFIFLHKTLRRTCFGQHRHIYLHSAFAEHQDVGYLLAVRLNLCLSCGAIPHNLHYVESLRQVKVGEREQSRSAYLCRLVKLALSHVKDLSAVRLCVLHYLGSARSVGAYYQRIHLGEAFSALPAYRHQAFRAYKV